MISNDSVVMMMVVIIIVTHCKKQQWRTAAYTTDPHLSQRTTSRSKRGNGSRQATDRIEQAIARARKGESEIEELLDDPITFARLSASI